MSLARLWGEQGRRAEARDLLASVYGWFTEGFDSADLNLFSPSSCLWSLAYMNVPMSRGGPQTLPSLE